MLILGIDPGQETTGFCFYDTVKKGIYNGLVGEIKKIDEHTICNLVNGSLFNFPIIHNVVAESVCYYGPQNPAGQSTFRTAEIVGEFRMAAFMHNRAFDIMERPSVCLAICNLRGAKKPQVGARLLEMHPGGKGTKKNPGPLYGIANHAWDALAVVVAWNMKREEEERNACKTKES